MTQASRVAIDEKLAREIADLTVDLAKGAGEILLGHFGRQLTIEYKDEAPKRPR